LSAEILKKEVCGGPSGAANRIVAQLKRDEVFAPSTTIWAPQAEMGDSIPD